MYWQSKTIEFGPTLLAVVQHVGDFAVYIFFIVSGYIMVQTTNYDVVGLPAVKHFLINRLVRVVPLYWIATFVELGLNSQHGKGLQIEKLIHSLFFVPQSATPVMRPILGVGWTLNYEMFFYVMFALSLFLPRKRAIAAVLGVICMLIAFGGFAKPWFALGQPTTAVAFLTAPLLLTFALGMLLGVVVRHDDSNSRTHSSSFVFAVLMALIALDIVAATMWFANQISPNFLPLVGVSLAFASVAFAAVTDIGKPSLFGRALVGLGGASYALYLFHFFAIAAVGRAWKAFGITEMPWLFSFCAMAAALGVGIAVYRLVDAPLSRALRPSSRTTKAQSQTNVGAGNPALSVS
ncbi:acyltransferase family protein [Variibacter gotjawalensis]|uniref:acyltransferase family protein n=1 Tax=Variibacter gotjawalensis TaxID=1333996 RepID=UPI001DD79825|nr:acyltransferase [Variibacter gotjawalensis]NIK47324.1 peptidoglycan/LPS O-acetylase OafA/YrhL [Variibacter gotjawalensis]